MFLFDSNQWHGTVETAEDFWRAVDDLVTYCGYVERDALAYLLGQPEIRPGVYSYFTLNLGARTFREVCPPEWLTRPPEVPLSNHPIATPEPAPIEGTGDVWAEVIADTRDPALRVLFEARRQFGIDKYGTPLQRGNGRNHRNDLEQELCDGIPYARAADMPATQWALTMLLVGGEAWATRARAALEEVP